MFVINDHALDTLQGDVYDIIDIIEAFISDGLASSLLQVETKVLNAPFPTVTLVVVFGELLDGHICEMDVHIVQFSYVGCVLFIAETGESLRTKPHLEGSVASDKHVYSEIEFLLADEEGVVYIP